MNIFRNAGEAQRRRCLPGLCSGRQIGALGPAEPGAGSDALGSMRTSATRDGDHYRLNGTKPYVTDGPAADVLLVQAETDQDEGAKGITAFIVEKGFPGFRVAQKLTKTGFRGSPTGELVFDDCRVPAANLMSEEDRGVQAVTSGLDLERAMVAPLCLGICGARWNCRSSMRARAGSSGSRSPISRWCAEGTPTCTSGPSRCAS